ncbi:MAG TPA: DUF4440 domain-containing protein [Candidatus Binatia bacterium]|nr:DUF4440 domain-containing protein [Candidatus Binatia bacterium]
MDPLADLAVRETMELHDFFGRWLRPDADAPRDIARLDRALAPEFRLIGPDGGIRERAAVLAWIAGARGSRGGDFRIEVSHCRPAWQSAEAILLEYVETQYGSGKTTRRLSTALFGRAPSAPCGVVWRHLQETWLQGDI